MVEPADTDEFIYGLKMAAAAVGAAVFTAALVIGGGQWLAPSLFSPGIEPAAPAEAVVVRIADR